MNEHATSLYLWVKVNRDNNSIENCGAVKARCENDAVESIHNKYGYPTDEITIKDVPSMERKGVDVISVAEIFDLNDVDNKENAAE